MPKKKVIEEVQEKVEVKEKIKACTPGIAAIKAAQAQNV